jgi:N-acetylmuramoyl-L-alanine amidase
MPGSLKRTTGMIMLPAAIVVAIMLPAVLLHAAETDLPIYFEDSVLILKTQTINRVQYLPLADLVRQLNLPFTNDATQEVFTIRGATSQIVLTRNSAAISVNNQLTLLPSPVLHENGAWLVPPEFLQQGLTRLTGIEFHRRSGAPRIFAGAVKPIDLAMNAQNQGTLTRLTLRTGVPVNVEFKRDMPQHRTTLIFAAKAIDPGKESLDYKDRLVGSITFNDSDGIAKIIVETTDEVGDVRSLTADESRVHFIDFLRKPEVTEAPPAAPAAPVAAGAAPPADNPVRPTNVPVANTSGIRVVVIDPGHGGIDIGSSGMNAQEKDLTLAMARKLRSTLQARLGTTVIMTRDADTALTSEARSSVGNNNQANLFVSIHVGNSPNKADFASSVYVIQDEFAVNLAPAGPAQRLFQPWYLGYRNSRESSMEIAGFLSEELSNAFPGWNFPLRTGPVAVLASTTMPSVLIEIGNVNNPASTQALLDSTFQTKVGTTITAAIERFAAVHPVVK